MRIPRLLISLMLVVSISKLVVVPTVATSYGQGVDIEDVQMAIDNACPGYELRGFRKVSWVYSGLS